MNVRSCVRKPPITITASTWPLPTQSPYISTFHRRPFHHYSSQKADHALPNHYETLEVATTASPTEIKKQFYKLSKSHHPDLHPDDPNAAHKFVQISEAYATLSSAEARARYDQQFLSPSSSSNPNGYTTPKGSFSSSGPGGRPASGLSKRRTQFRGPPPSFYRSGGWGQQSAKRGAAQSQSPHQQAGENPSSGSGSASASASSSRHDRSEGKNDEYDVPHFDRRAHTQRLSEIERTRHRARRKREERMAGAEGEGGGGGSVLWNFVMVSGVLGAIYGVSSLTVGAGPTAPKAKEKAT